MPNWSGTVLTTKGLALQAKVAAGATMEITKLKIGDGILDGGGSVAALNDLVSPKKNVDISALTPLSGGTCKVHGVVTNDGIVTGFYVRELGIFADDPDLGEILYAYAADGAPDFLPAEGGPVAVSEELVINLAFSPAANITANISPDGLVTVNMLDAAIAAHDDDPDAHGLATTYLPFAGGAMTGAINEAKGADIASTATTNIGAATGNFVIVTGTTTITSLGTVQAGTRRTVKFGGALTLTHNATSLILPGAANFTTAAGDVAEFVSLGSGNWVCTNYQTAANQFTNSLSSNGWQKLPGGLILQWGETASLTRDTRATITFPIAFPSACLGGLATPDDAGAPTLNDAAPAYFTKSSVTQCVITYDGASGGSAPNRSVFWLAIGY